MSENRYTGFVSLFMTACLSSLSIYAAPNDPLLPVHFHNEIEACLRVKPGPLVIEGPTLQLQASIKSMKSLAKCGCKLNQAGYAVEKIFVRQKSQWSGGRVSINRNDEYRFVLDRNFDAKHNQAEYSLTVGCAAPE